MKNSETTIKRDTNYSFVEITKKDGKEFLRKLENGNVDYSNACMLFHSNNVSIEIGNEIVK